MVAAALAAGSRDNATALVLRVLGLAPERLEDATAAGPPAAVPARLKVGDALDGYTRHRAGGRHRRAPAVPGARHGHRRAGGAQDAARVARQRPRERAMLAHEAWLGAARRRRTARRLRARARGRRCHAFYAVFDWHAGRTLEQLLAASAVLDRRGRRGRARHRARARPAAPPGRDPPRHQAGQPAPGRRRPVAHARPRRGAVRPRERRAARAARRHAELHEPRAVGSRRGDSGRRRGQRPVRARRHAVPLADRPLPYGEIEPYQSAPYRRDPWPCRGCGPTCRSGSTTWC